MSRLQNKLLLTFIWVNLASAGKAPPCHPTVTPNLQDVRLCFLRSIMSL